MSIKSSLISLTAFILVFVQLREVHNFGPLIKNIHDKYETSGVTIISGPNDLSFEKITSWHEAIRMLSNEGISTRSVKFRLFENELTGHSKRSDRSLIVITIHTMEELHTFESMVKDFHSRSLIWLIFFTADARKDVCAFCRNPRGSLLSSRFGSKVLISCCDSTMIEEWRYNEENHTRKQKLGRVIMENSTIVWFPDEPDNGRRYSLDGKSFRIATDKMNSRNPNFFSELLMELSQAMNFTSEIMREEHGGKCHPGTLKNCTGVFGRILRREADLGISGVHMTSERHEMVSFTTPIHTGPLQLHFRKHDIPHIVWNAYFEAFTVDVWIIIIGLILTTPILLTIIRYQGMSPLFPLLIEHYLRIWGIYCQQGLTEFPAERPSRIIYITILLSAFITSSAYSARVISSLATPSYPPFRTVEQFVQDGTYNLIMLGHSANSPIYELSDQALMNKLMSFLKPNYLLPRNDFEAFEQVCSERVAYYAPAFRKIIHLNLPCEITSIDTGATASISMMMPKDSEYLDFVNHHFQKFKENGIWRRLQAKYSAKVYEDQHDFKPVVLQGIIPLLIILAIGFLMGLIVFIIEQKATKITEAFKHLRNRQRWKDCKRHLCFQRRTIKPEHSHKTEFILYKHRRWDGSGSVTVEKKRQGRMPTYDALRVRTTLPSIV